MKLAHADMASDALASESASTRPMLGRFSSNPSWTLLPTDFQALWKVQTPLPFDTEPRESLRAKWPATTPQSGILVDGPLDLHMGCCHFVIPYPSITLQVAKRRTPGPVPGLAQAPGLIDARGLVVLRDRHRGAGPAFARRMRGKAAELILRAGDLGESLGGGEGGRLGGEG